uniref:Major capsid protein n=1 Tax=Globodera pallida TaxID=36090 RepID=A0A183BTZ0_GLOPA
MEKLNPLTVKNFLVWPFKEVVYDDVVAELGVYTFVVGNMQDGTVSHYAQPGHLVRTKLASSNEGGISTGTGAFDSVYLH